MPSIHNARFNSLQIAYTDLMNAAQRSPFIQVTPVDAMEGWPAEKYIITFTCKGLSRLSPDGIPELSEHHEMKLEFSSSFPANEPSLLWMTDIWHPNIGHQTHHVCTNELSNWYPQKSLMDFVVGIGEMVQYKRYFARAEPPFPEDREVAKWVREVAEPKGWVGPERPIDPRPMLKEHAIRRASPGGTPAAAEKPVRRIQLGSAVPNTPESKGRIRLGTPVPPA
jgi:hypothetical protein